MIVTRALQNVPSFRREPESPSVWHDQETGDPGPFGCPPAAAAQDMLRRGDEIYAKVAVGIGCRKHATADAIIALIEAVLAEAGVARPDRLAAPHFKIAEPGLAEAASRLDCDLVWVDESSLAAQQPRCLTRSDQTEIHTGHASIAEACALAAAGGAAARLVIPRRSNGTVTCALALGEVRP